jgi:hypothetical protein
MTKKKVYSFLSLFLIVFILNGQGIVASLTDTQDQIYLWANGGDNNDFDNIHYYKSFRVCFLFWCSTNTHHLAQVHYEWIYEKIEETNSIYDFWAGYLKLDITPEARKLVYLKNGYIRFPMRSNSMIVDYLPYTTSGSTSYQAQFGIGVNTGQDGLGYSVQFQVSRSYNVPDITIYPYTNFNFGGYQKWNFNVNNGQRLQRTFHFTFLVREQYPRWYTDFSDATIYLHFTYVYNVKQTFQIYEYLYPRITQ